MTELDHEQRASLSVPRSAEPTESRAETRSLSDLFSPGASPVHRQATFESYFFSWRRETLVAFWLMLMLAAAIASLGLSENSAATVIGAMIVAPLGAPITALGVSVVIGWPRRSLALLALISAAAVSVIALGFGVGTLLPDATPNDQILARTTPDVRDFGIAVFAGVAGAYGCYRKELSTVLAGVAIAVALVPPLCAVGLLLEESHLSLARNAFVLFLTNLTGITLAAAIVSIALRAVSLHALLDRRVAPSLAVLVLACALILIPLGINYSRVVGSAAETAHRYAVIRDVLERSPQPIALTSLELDSGGASATIGVRARYGGSVDLAALGHRLEAALGVPVSLSDTGVPATTR